MRCCWPRVGAVRPGLSLVLLLASLISIGSPTLALAVPAAARAPGLSAGLAAGCPKTPSCGSRDGRGRLQRSGSAWLQRVSVDVSYRERPPAAYDMAATGPPQKPPAPGDRPWPGEHGTHDPSGQTGGHLALYKRPDVLDRDLTLALRGRVENDWLRDYERLGIGTSLRTRRFELATTLFDEVPGPASVRGGVPEHRLDGYGIALGARLPEFPWVWIRARRQWQIPIDGERTAVSDRLSLQLGPSLPLEVETGTTGEGDHRSWFAQLRFTIELGGS